MRGEYDPDKPTAGEIIGCLVFIVVGVAAALLLLGFWQPY
jgi:hypothetical protein